MQDRNQDLIPFDEFILHFGFSDDEGWNFLKARNILFWIDPEDRKRFVLHSDIDDWLTAMGGAMDGSRQYNACSIVLSRNDGSDVARGTYKPERFW